MDSIVKQCPRVVVRQTFNRRSHIGPLSLLTLHLFWNGSACPWTDLENDRGTGQSYTAGLSAAAQRRGHVLVERNNAFTVVGRVQMRRGNPADALHTLYALYSRRF